MSVSIFSNGRMRLAGGVSPCVMESIAKEVCRRISACVAPVAAGMAGLAHCFQDPERGWCAAAVREPGRLFVNDFRVAMMNCCGTLPFGLSLEALCAHVNAGDSRAMASIAYDKPCAPLRFSQHVGCGGTVTMSCQKSGKVFLVAGSKKMLGPPDYDTLLAVFHSFVSAIPSSCAVWEEVPLPPCKRARRG